MLTPVLKKSKDPCYGLVFRQKDLREQLLTKISFGPYIFILDSMESAARI